MNLTQLREQGWTVVYDLPRQLQREIIFEGAGAYSMDDSYTYHKGVFPTWSRIHIEGNCELCKSHIPYPDRFDGICEPCAISEGDQEMPDSSGETIGYGEAHDYT